MSTLYASSLATLLYSYATSLYHLKPIFWRQRFLHLPCSNTDDLQRIWRQVTLSSSPAHIFLFPPPHRCIATYPTDPITLPFLHLSIHPLVNKNTSFSCLHHLLLPFCPLHHTYTHTYAVSHPTDFITRPSLPPSFPPFVNRNPPYSYVFIICFSSLLRALHIPPPIFRP